MLDEEDYSSDTSDEDFKIEGQKLSSDSSSEDDSTPELDLTSDLCKKGKRHSKKNKTSKFFVKKGKVEDEEIEKVNPEGNEEIKQKADSLWADFLDDVEEKPPPPAKLKANSWASLLGNSNKCTLTNKSSLNMQDGSTNKEAVESKSTDSKNTVKVTKIFEFAGEEVRLEKEVSCQSADAREAQLEQCLKNSKYTETKRPVGATGVIGFLDSKKKKLTTLEKTKLDWDLFKDDEGLQEELESHKKSKDGYLEKQAFLERADLRQFEIERDLRMSKRSKR